MIEIKLTQGHTAKIDDEDFPKVSLTLIGHLDGILAATNTLQPTIKL